MKYKFFSIAILFLVLTSFKADKLPKTFKDLLDRANLEFIHPEGLEPVEIIKNRQMEYEYAVKYPDRNYEVRYAVRPLDTHLKQYEEWKKTKGPNDIMIHPNKLYASLLQVTALNISGGNMGEISTFEPEAVREEFNADWGATTFVQVGKEFGQDYKYCMIVALHKDDLGDAYYFYLSDDAENFGDLMAPAFHTMKFKK